MTVLHLLIIRIPKNKYRLREFKCMSIENPYNTNHNGVPCNGWPETVQRLLSPVVQLEMSWVIIYSASILSGKRGALFRCVFPSIHATSVAYLLSTINTKTLVLFFLPMSNPAAAFQLKKNCFTMFVDFDFIYFSSLFIVTIINGWK